MKIISIDQALTAVKTHCASVRKFLRDMGNHNTYNLTEVVKWIRNNHE